MRSPFTVGWIAGGAMAVLASCGRKEPGAGDGAVLAAPSNAPAAAPADTAPPAASVRSTTGAPPTAPPAPASSDAEAASGPVDPPGQWRYLYGQTAPSGWSSDPKLSEEWTRGEAILGYGDDVEKTRLDFGADPDQKPITAYFARTLSLQSVADVRSAEVLLVVDDGAVLYWNGGELARVNMPDGAVGSETTALKAVGGDGEGAITPVAIPADKLKNGVNFLAVEVHQARPSSTDIRFDAKIKLHRSAP